MSEWQTHMSNHSTLNSHSLKYSTVPTFVKMFLFLLFGTLCFISPILEPDSGGYIDNSVIRSPLYPIILSIYTKIFDKNFFDILIVIQLLAGFSAAIFLASTLKRLFVLPNIVFYLVALGLLAPYYSHPLFGNKILPEAVCYPLFLLYFSYLLEGLQYKKSKKLIIAMGLAGLLVLTRKQFLFLYPATGIILIYILLFERRVFKTFTLLICFLLSMVGTTLAERTYQYIYHGQFKSVPFTGMQLIIAPLYLAHPTDEELFENETERALFKDIFATMSDKKINFNSLPQRDSYFHVATYTQFYANYNHICWQSLAPLLAKYPLNTVYERDTTLTHMAIILILNNLKGFFTLYLLNIVFNIGGIYFVLLLCFTTLAALNAFIKARHAFALCYLLASLLTAGNYFLIALVEPVLPRYSGYTDSIQMVTLLILITAAFQTQQAFFSQRSQLKRDL